MAHTTTRGAVTALEEFDRLPSSAFVRVAVVAQLLCASRTTIWRMAKDGRLPKPKRLSERVTGFNVGELRQAIAAF